MATYILPLEFNKNKHLSKIEDQRYIGSCTANAFASLIEYNLNVDVSRLYIYYFSKHILNKYIDTDTGSENWTYQNVFKTYGFVPEELYPYRYKNMNSEVPKDIVSIGKSLKCDMIMRVPLIDKFPIDPKTNGIQYSQMNLKYWKALDYKSIIKNILHKQQPVVFAITVFDNIDEPLFSGEKYPIVHLPSSLNKVTGGSELSWDLFINVYIFTFPFKYP